MKTGIIGLPQVGKTSLFRILTKAHLSAQAHANPREAHIGVAKVPDDRLDRLAALYNPKKLTHTSVEYVDVGAIGQDALKETAYIGHLRATTADGSPARSRRQRAQALSPRALRWLLSRKRKDLDQKEQMRLDQLLNLSLDPLAVKTTMADTLASRAA